METIRAVVFDLYGTLIRIHPDDLLLRLPRGKVWQPRPVAQGLPG